MRSPQPLKKPIRMPLVRMQTAYFGEAKKNLGDMLLAIAGITIRGEVDGRKTLEELRAENGEEKQFTLRGLRSQLERYVRTRKGVRIARRITHASHPEPTHRVLVYGYAGLLLRESSYEDMDGDIALLPCYDPETYEVTPLAKVDVRVPLDYLSYRYKGLDDYREAVYRYAERVAFEWYRWFMRHRRSYRQQLPGASGIAAEVIRSLGPRHRPMESRVLNKSKNQFGRAPSFDGVQTPSSYPRSVFASKREDVYPEVNA